MAETWARQAPPPPNARTAGGKAGGAKGRSGEGDAWHGAHWWDDRLAGTQAGGRGLTRSGVRGLGCFQHLTSGERTAGRGGSLAALPGARGC
jgi:hypothetical protein